MIKFNVKLPSKDSITRSIIEAAKKQVSNKLRNVECPDHHQHPEITITGSATHPVFEVSGCCQKLIDAAEKALS